MNVLQELDFDYFVRVHPAGDTLAFWCFSGNDFDDLAAIRPEEVWQWIGSQFSAEDQASVGDDDVWGDTTLKERLVLFAPVQLAERWSPLPYAANRLGSPDILRVSQDAPTTVIAVWRSPRPSPDPHEQHPQERLVDEIFDYAAKSGLPFAIACFAGFSFGMRELSRTAKQALRRAGFAFDMRSPF